MKTSLEIEDKISPDAEMLRRQYLRLNDKPVVNTSTKKDDLLTPFLLSIPVIIMLIILIYSL